MIWKRRKRKKGKYISVMLKAMLKPILLTLLPVLNGAIEVWKLQLLEKAKILDPEKLIGFLSDSIDELQGNLTEQIKKVIEEK